jgi:hypothetical protein
VIKVTLKEIQKEIDRLNILKRQLEEQVREAHRQQARKFVGKCYKSENGKLIKIIDIPRTFLAMTHSQYNEYQFPAIFLNYPDNLPRNKYINDDSDDFSPVYYDTIYMDIKRGIPEEGLVICHEDYTEITKEEFDAEYDKCMAHFKELTNV